MIQRLPAYAVYTVFLSLCIAIAPNTNAGALNDTGITGCADNSSNNLPCPVASFPRQDAQLGRDAVWKAGKLQKIGGGHAGFDYTKLDGAGRSLPAGATAWACVRDNVTGLIWENKTADGGLRDYRNNYTWYNPDSTTNGGYPGTPNGGVCAGSACDTDAYKKAVNAQKLCGFTTWRLPSRGELQSLVDSSIAPPGPAIDGDYFANPPSKTEEYVFWTTSSHLDYQYLGYAWFVGFTDGEASFDRKENSYAVRLVRGGQ